MQAPLGTTLSGRPVAAFTFALNYAFAPADAREVFLAPADASAARIDQVRRNLWGYHAINLVIHLSAALALFGVTRRTFLAQSVNQPNATHATMLAWCASVLWVVQPLTTAAVTYVIQRVELLMALCLLLTLYFSIRAWKGPVWWTVAAALTCAAGMATKESMVVAPLIVLSWDAIFAGRGGSWRALFRQHRLLYTLLAASWGLLAALVIGQHRPDAAGFGFETWPWWRYLATQAGVILHYLRLAIYPSPLVFRARRP